MQIVQGFICLFIITMVVMFQLVKKCGKKLIVVVFLYKFVFSS